MLSLLNPTVLTGMLACCFRSTAAFSYSYATHGLHKSSSSCLTRNSFQQRLASRDMSVFMRTQSENYNIDQPRSLRGKTAFITGSSGGIGAGIAKIFAQSGADVIVHYNSRRDGAVSLCKDINDRYNDAVSRNQDSSKSDNRDTDLPGRCIGVIQADFRDPAAVSEMFECIQNQILTNNRLDILVNNAGIVTKLALEDDDDQLSTWHETMAVNLHAPLQLMKLAHLHMRSKTMGSRKGGVIINNTSIHGSRSVEFMTAYAASKAALDSLTRGLACEFANDGVRVNAIAPGVVPVERTAHVFSDPKVTEMWLPHLPVGRLGTVEDIAHATLLLAVNEWMTGTVLTVDGGMMARANMPVRPKPAKPDRRVNGSSSSEVKSSKVSFEILK